MCRLADAFFSLTLTSGGDAFTDAGSYTFTASTESGNYALKDLAAKTYTIEQAELTIKAVDVPDVVYGTDAEEVKAKFTVTYDGLSKPIATAAMVIIPPKTAY